MAKLDAHSPLQPVKYTKADVLAIQALLHGNANEVQQQRALSFIIENICKTYDLPYRPGPDGNRETDFAMGKQFVGQQLVKMTKLKAGQIKD